MEFVFGRAQVLMHLDATLRQGADLSLDAVLPGSCAQCLFAWDAAVGSTVHMCDMPALAPGCPKP